jgi:uncharacterized membrane protein (DUF4010 family)
VAVLTDPDFLINALIAVGVGALVGLEREHHRDEVSSYAGVRTFALVSLFGFIAAYLTTKDPDFAWVLIAGVLLVGAFAIFLAYIKFEKGFPGLTTPMAMMVTFFAGSLVGLDMLFAAAVVTLVTTFLLVSRRRLHRFAEILDDDEIIGALQFLTLAIILYPLTTELNLDAPWDVFNPGGILALNFVLLLVVFVSAISFVSFVIIRKEGPKRGLEFSGLLGGMINSEATTASISNMVKERKDLLKTAISGILFATGVMFMRNLIVVALSDPTLSTATILLVPAGISTVVAFLLGLFIKSEEVSDQKLEVKSPFAIMPALKFAGLILVISLISYLANEYLGSYGVYISAIGGFVSSAAVAASLGTLVFTDNLDPLIAAQTIMLACVFSCVNKIIITRSVDKDLASAAKSRLVMVTVVAVVNTAALFIISLVV